MAALIKIDTISIVKDGLIVKLMHSIKVVNRKKFEQWIDRDDKRCGSTWEVYYASECLYDDVYEYLVIREGSRNFDIKGSLGTILK